MSGEKMQLPASLAQSAPALKVRKRDGAYVDLSFDEVLKRIKYATENPTLLKNVNYVDVATKVINGIIDGISTKDLDLHAIQFTKDLIMQHYEYGILSSRLSTSGYARDFQIMLEYNSGLKLPTIAEQFPVAIRMLLDNKRESGQKAPLIDPVLYYAAMDNPELCNAINASRDSRFPIDGFTLLQSKYFLKARVKKREFKDSTSEEVWIRTQVETPQTMYMRTAMGIHCVEENPNLELWRKEFAGRRKLTFPKGSSYSSPWANEDLAKENISKIREAIPQKILLEKVAKTDDEAAAMKIEKRKRDLVFSDDSVFSKMEIEKGAFKLKPEALAEIVHLYNMLSEHYVSMATPIMFSSGTQNPQMSSCNLLTIPDSLDKIYDTLKSSALIAKHAGGIGRSGHGIRSKGTDIAGTNGMSDGYVSMLRVFDASCGYVGQGGGKRAGASAEFLSPYHPDFVDFIRSKSTSAANRIRRLNLAAWIPDFFMKRVAEKKMWYFIDPHVHCKLYKYWGEEAECRYEELIAAGKHTGKPMPATELWNEILHAVEEDPPYIMFSDAANRNNNQKNIGAIISSNLCTEIIEYSSKNEIAVCNLASICLPRYINTENASEIKRDKFYLSLHEPGKRWNFAALKAEFATRTFWSKFINFDEIVNATRTLVRTLNRTIDCSFYSVVQCARSNFKHRPLGIGVQGLADLYSKLGLPFNCEAACFVNHLISETIEFGFYMETTEQARLYGPYSSYAGSPASMGVLRPDMTGGPYGEVKFRFPLTMNWDGIIRPRVKEFGMRNSLGTAWMPTAATADILENSACFEPFPNIYYKRTNDAGEKVHTWVAAINELQSIGIWSLKLRNKIIKNGGSLIGIPEIPKYIEDIYKGAYDLGPKPILRQAIDRSRFICQSQSINYFTRGKSATELSQLYFTAWRNGLVVGSYYINSTVSIKTGQFNSKDVEPEPETIEPKPKTVEPEPVEELEDNLVCARDSLCKSCGT